MSGPGPLAARAAATSADSPAPETKLHDIENRWSAQIKVGGVPACVYQVEHEVNKTTCYIVAEEGKEFEVTWKHEKPAQTDECGRLRVDGTPIGGGITKRRLGDRDHYTWLGNYISATQIRPFVFAPIALTDDPSTAVTDKAVLIGLGSIQLDLHRIVVQEYTGYDQTYKDLTKGPVSRFSHPCFDSLLNLFDPCSP